MALVSPGVEVSIVDESTYIPSSTNSVPYILVATAQNKVSGSGVGIAAGTTAANANKVFLITSQRDLVATFGNPFFYNTAIGTPINGYELNEYGLLAAYSALGVSNRAFVQRVDVDLAELTASLVRPVGDPPGGTNWFNVGVTEWGLFSWNQTTGAFTNIRPSVILQESDVTGDAPNSDFGSIGDYAVVAIRENNPIYYKGGAAPASNTSSVELSNLYNSWVLVGTDDWMLAWPTYQAGTVFTGTLTPGNQIVINGVGVQVPSGPNNDVQGLSNAINSATIPGVYSAHFNGRLVFYSNSEASTDGSTEYSGIDLQPGSGGAALFDTLGIVAGTYQSPAIQQSPNFTVPRWRITDIAGGRPTGSVWQKTTAPNLGANIVVNRFDAILGAYTQQPCPLYANFNAANAALDATGGGRNIPVGTVFFGFNTNPVVNGTTLPTLTGTLFDRFSSGPTVITGTAESPTFGNGDQFSLSTSVPNSAVPTTPVTVTINGTTPAAFIAAVSAANVPGVSASVDSAGKIVFTQINGGQIFVRNVTGTPITTGAGFNTTIQGVSADAFNPGTLILSSWRVLTYTASNSAPVINPANGRLWYYGATDQVDIMINDGNRWFGYRNVASDVRGFNLTLTNTTGPLVSPTPPTQQTDGNALVYGDLWIDTSDLELYPLIKRWQNVDGADQWVTLNNADQTTENGVLFADARWSATGTVDPITGAIPSIAGLLTSNYTDADRPDPGLFPSGMLMFNLRRSSFNVKSYQNNYFNQQTFDFPVYDASQAYPAGSRVLFNVTVFVAIENASAGINPTNASVWQPLQTATWVTASANRNDGSPNMGRLAQRSIVVAAMRAGIDSSIEAREEQRQFNLIACPGYPELLPNMINLNNARTNTAFVIGDTPLRLSATGTDVLAWATNNSGLGLPTSDGLTVSDPFAAVFYPSCQTTDLTGNPVVQPASHMMLRTIIRSDEIGFPWLAPAGTRRGLIDNAAAIGFINSRTGAFETIGVNQGLRDVLYENRVNPISFIPGVGITNYGNKTIFTDTSALDRINVARLVAFIRGRLEGIGKQFLFEPNDQITRDEIKNAINGLMIDLVNKRGVYDFLVVCDLTNNTPSRIDANELYVDIAIEPVKSVEFIYIPLRIKNTGEISGAISTVASAG
jgi:hypothetical protein